MRFAWLRKNSANYVLVKQGFTHPLAVIRRVYNAVFWVFVLPFVTAKIDYRTGFIAFTIVILVRLGANLYVNVLNLEPEQFDSFPFRIS